MTFAERGRHDVITETHYRESGSSPPVDDVARTLPVETLPDFLATLARAQALALARLVTPTVAPTREPESTDLIGPDEVARLLSIKPGAVRRLAALRPARRRLSPKVIRYSRAAVERLIKRSAA
jgi:hypothetical protein